MTGEAFAGEDEAKSVIAARFGRVVEVAGGLGLIAIGIPIVVHHTGD